MGLTRRAVLERIGAVGGVGAAYLAMETLGLAVATPAGAENFELPRGSGGGKSVVILGAGIAGLVSAYELRRAGYDVTVLEARDRVAGRVWTIRGGDAVEQMGRPLQRAAFDEGLYFNAGAARLPSTHRCILGYAHRLGVPLEVWVNSNRNVPWDFAGKVQPERRMVNDIRGHVGELLAKAIDKHALDQEMPKDELAAFRQFLAAYSQLNGEGRYQTGGSSGYSVDGGGYNQVPQPVPPLSLKELLPNQAITLPYIFEHIHEMQATMLQPVGGMDRIAHALYEQVKPSVRLSSPITAIRRTGDRVRIEHGPGTQATEADYCVCTIPMNLLARLPNDFSPAKKAAFRAVNYFQPIKVAFESPRFWETDDHIYGGLGWTDRITETIMYPSSGIGSPKGVLVASYVLAFTRPDNPQAFSALSHEQRFQACRESVEASHPGKSHLLAKGVTVDWRLTRWSEGVTPNWPGGPFAPADRGAAYAELLKPEGPIVFAGEHLSYQGAWQEGAALSAHEALKLVASISAERKAA
ncbi:flavin monoamine oxidase family protein [Sphingomonas hankyongi]|nr:FAD-dependent oxidoreductase [Sphingomonas hankyongi]